MAVNNTTYTGENGVVKFVGGDSTLSTVASIRTFSVDSEVATVESTVMGTGTRSYIPGLTQFSGSFDFYLKDDDTGQIDIIDYVNNGGNDALANIELYPSGATTGIKLSGDVIVTNLTISSNFDGMVEGSATFQGSGALIKTNL
jgi:predicted secreted protein